MTRMLLVAAFGIAIAIPQLGQAQSLQMGADNRPMSQGTCISAARKAMSDRNLNTTFDGSTVWGTGSNVVVFVHCVPIDRGVHIVVAASSNTGAVAEKYRNDIRIQVFSARAFD